MIASLFLWISVSLWVKRASVLSVIMLLSVVVATLLLELALFVVEVVVLVWSSLSALVMPA